jgi:hypothetical protein
MGLFGSPFGKSVGAYLLGNGGNDTLTAANQLQGPSVS